MEKHVKIPFMAVFTVIEGSDTGKVVSMEETSFTIGRGHNASLILSDPTISRKHCTIHRKGSAYLITDQGSNNGVWLNNIRTSNGQIKDGDIIGLGNTRISFSEQGSTPESPEIIFDANMPALGGDQSILMDADDIDWLKTGAHKKASTQDGSPDTLKHFRQLQAMLRMSNALANIIELEPLSEELLNIVFDETRASRGFIMLYDKTGELKPVAIKKRDKDDDSITISRSIISTVVDEKKGLLSSDMMTDQRFQTEQSIIAHQIRSCMCVPMMLKKEIVGIIHIDSDITANIFTADDLEFLIAIGNQAAVCVQNVRLRQKIADELIQRNKLSQFFPPAHVELIMQNKLDLELGGKHEEVTTLFCDIRSFTKISEELAATEVMNMLNDFFSVITDIVFRFEGMVDNFLGDCVLAVFGESTQQESAPERAVRAAMAMQKAQADLNIQFAAENRKTFGVGIGIHSGIVSRGNIGSPQYKKYTVIGNTVNVCSRLCSLAQADEILISPQTAHALPNDIPLEEQKPVQVKNVKDPLTPYLVHYQD